MDLTLQSRRVKRAAGSNKSKPVSFFVSRPSEGFRALGFSSLTRVLGFKALWFAGLGFKAL